MTQDDEIKEGIKKTFDDVAAGYDNNAHFIISTQKTVEYIECMQDPKSILDLSTGTGNIAMELAKKFPTATIHGVDISEEMLKIAAQKSDEQGLKNITYHLQDVENLDFGELRFDIIACGYGLFFYPQMERVFCDVCDRLKEGGKFIFSTFRESAFQPYSKIFLDMLGDAYGIKPPQRLEKKQLATKEEIEEFCTLVPYQNQIQEIDIRFAMSIEEWWKLLNSTGYQGLLSKLGDNYDLFEKEYLEYLGALHPDGNIVFNADSFVCIVHKG